MSLAHTLLRRRSHDHRPPIVVLAQGNDDLLLNTSSDVDLIAANREYWTQQPTAGETYLAQLVSEERVGCVVQLGVSNSLSRALARFLEPGDYLNLVKGEHAEEYIVRALTFDSPRPRIVKLRGDIVGRSAQDTLSVSAALGRALARMANSADVVWVGPWDPAVLNQVFPGFAHQLWLVSPKAAEVQPSSTRVNITPIASDVDDFFRNLALFLAKEELAPLDRVNRRRMGDQISRRQSADASHSDRLIQRLAQEIRDACDEWSEPTLLVYVHDPDAPGGSEVEKRIVRHLGGAEGRKPESMHLMVRGGEIRWVGRHVEGTVSPESADNCRDVR